MKFKSKLKFKSECKSHELWTPHYLTQDKVRHARLDRQCVHDHERRTEQPDARQARWYVHDYQHRDAEWPEAGQSRLERRELEHERRAAEHPETRQSRLERLQEHNPEQRAAERQTQGKLGLLKTGRLTDRGQA